MILQLLFLFVTSTSITLSTAESQGVDRDSKQARILEYENELDGSGGYRFAYRTSDGTHREEVGTLKNFGTDNEILEVTGKVSWVGDDGKEYTLSFISNENGYHVLDDHPQQKSQLAIISMPELLRASPKLISSLLGRG